MWGSRLADVGCCWPHWRVANRLQRSFKREPILSLNPWLLKPSIRNVLISNAMFQLYYLTRNINALSDTVFPMIWHFSVSRLWEFLEKRYMQPISIQLICLIASKESWQTMYSWKSLVDGRARRSLSRNKYAAAAQIPATNDGRRTGSRETQNHRRCLVKHHPRHSSDLSLATFRPAFEKILFTS